MATSVTISQLPTRTDAELLNNVSNLPIEQGGTAYKATVEQLAKITGGRLQFQVVAVGEDRFIEYRESAAVSWTRINTNIRGATGSTGATGATGPAGPTGPTGPSGGGASVGNTVPNSTANANSAGTSAEAARVDHTHRLTAPVANGTTVIGDIYRNADTLRYRDSGNVERLLLNATDNLANLASASTARTNLGLGALATKATVAAADIDTDAVTTAKILNANVTTAKIADSNVTGAKLATLASTDASKLSPAVLAITETVNTIAANTASPSLSEANGRMQTLTSNTGVTVSVGTLSDGNMILLRVIASASITVNVPASSATVKRSAGSITLANGEWVDISVTRMGSNYTWNIGAKLT